jgi:hypothetical protein
MCVLLFFPFAACAARAEQEHGEHRDRRQVRA